MRLSDFSLSNKKGLKIGDVDNGIDYDKIKVFKYNSKEYVNVGKCQDCKVASGCSSCYGLSYDESKDDSALTRTTHHCLMHKANVRAVEYFWNRMAEELNTKDTAREFYRKIASGNKSQTLLIYLGNSSKSYCYYKKNVKKKKVMDFNLINKAIELAEKNHINIMFFGKNPTNQIYRSIVDNVSDCGKSDILIHDGTIHKNFNNNIHILNIDRNEINSLFNYVAELLQSGIRPIRINISVKDLSMWTDNHLLNYKSELEKVAKFIFHNQHIIQINVLNSYKNKKVADCGCGVNNVTLAPNGKIYLCPGFYETMEEKYIGDIDTIQEVFEQLNFNIESSPTCKSCNNYSCKRCLLINKEVTNEYKIGADIQCKKSKIEQDIINKYYFV